MRVFMMYFVVFGTILAFIGLMGDDSLPGSGMFLWLLRSTGFCDFNHRNHFPYEKWTKIED